MPELPEGVNEENRPDWMTDEYLRHQSWAGAERDRVEEIRDEIIEEVSRREGVTATRWGTSVSNDGEHEVSFRLKIEGEAFEPREQTAFLIVCRECGAENWRKGPRFSMLVDYVAQNFECSECGRELETGPSIETTEFASNSGGSDE